MIIKRLAIILVFLGLFYSPNFIDLHGDIEENFNAIYIRVDFIYDSRLEVDWIRVSNYSCQLYVYDKSIKSVYLYIDSFTPLKFSKIIFPSGKTIFKPREVVLTPKYLYINLSRSREYGIYRIFLEKNIYRDIFDILVFSNQSIKYNISVAGRRNKSLSIFFDKNTYEIYSLIVKVFSFTSIEDITVAEPHFLNISCIKEINVPGYGKYYANMLSFIVFDEKVTIVNRGDRPTNLLINIIPVFRLKNVRRNVNKNLIDINFSPKFKKTYLYLNIPDIFYIKNSSFFKVDPLTKLYIPSKFFFKKLLNESKIMLSLHLKNITLKIYNSNKRELKEGYVTIFLSNGSIYRYRIDGERSFEVCYPPIFKVMVSLNDFRFQNITVIGFRENIAEIYVGVHDLQLIVTDMRDNSLSSVKIEVFSYSNLKSSIYYTDESGRLVIRNLIEGDKYMFRIFYRNIEVKRILIDFNKHINLIRVKCPIDDLKIYIRNPSGLTPKGINVTIMGDKGLILSNMTNELGEVVFKNIVYDTYNISIYSHHCLVTSKRMIFNGKNNPIIIADIHRYTVLLQDYWGNPLENYEVYLIGENGLNVKKISDERGQAVFEWIPRGNYSIKVFIPFFSKEIVKNITVPGFGYTIFKTDIVFHYKNIVVSINDIYIIFGLFLIISFTVIFLKCKDREVVIQ